MQHVAILNKSWGMLPKIVSGEKTIESRWYLNRAVPWGRVSARDTVYFKNSGEPVTVRAKVEKVLSFEDLSPEKVKEILDRWGRAIGIEDRQIYEYYEIFKAKKYCLLIFLKQAQEIELFNIDKTGFGTQAAWLSVDSIDQIKL